MGKYRVYEIAKEIDKDSKTVLEFLSEHKVSVKNHMSSVDEDVRSLIMKGMSKKTTAPAHENRTENQHMARHEAKPAAVTPVHTAKPETRVEVKPAAPRVEQHHTENRTAAPANAGTRPTGENKPVQKIVIHRNNNTNRPQGSYNNNRPQGGYNSNRPQGSYNNNRPQGGYNNNNGDRPRFNNNNGSNPNRPQGGYNNNRPQGGYNSNRPQGSYNNNRPQGGYNNRPNNGGNRTGGFNKPQPAPQPAPPVDLNAQHAGKDMGKRGQNFARHDNKKDKGKSNFSSRENGFNSYNNRNNRKHRNGNVKQETKSTQEIIRPTSVMVGDSIAVNEFAKLLMRSAAEVIGKLIGMGQMVTINQEIDHETAALVGMEFNCEIKDLPPEADPTEVPEVEDKPELRQPRPPVVTVMGHVDHGKTSLLDAIRKSHVTAREAGGITQHIGAYQVTCQGKPIVFLDTPGHEAFTAMRARGAQVTDVAVLVVAADDGVMPQTLEAIHHAKAAKVPIIVAINKIDKEGANPDFVKQQLAEQELIPEDWGGDTIMVPVSAHQKTGIAELLEMILLVAEVQELKANPDLPAQGTIIEAQLDKGRGPVATVLISRGTLHVGDTILAGTAYGKVRAMVNDRGENVKKALPSTPVEVLGLNDVPGAGDILDATDERIARSVAEKRIAKKKNEEQKAAKVSLDDIFNRIQEGELKELNIVVKADVQGTIEALKQSLTNIKNTEVRVVVVHAGVGTINESDVMLASAANALIIGFNVRPDSNARKVADTEKVDIRTYRVIYDALNDVEAAIKGMLAPKFKENIIGHVEIRQLITISKMLIAGGYVLDGKITRGAKVRLLRNGIVVHEGELDSLRRFKDDVKEVAQNFECGLTIDGYRDIKEGDIIEAYVMEQIAVE